MHARPDLAQGHIGWGSRGQVKFNDIGYKSDPCFNESTKSPNSVVDWLGLRLHTVHEETLCSYNKTF